MLLIEKRRLFIVLFLSFAMMLASSIYAYLIGMEAQQKGSAESLLFIGFIIAIVQLMLALALFHHAFRRKKDLIKLATLIKQGGNIDQKKIARFGDMGIQIKNMLKNIEAISNKKSLKIASLNGLTKALIDLIPTPILIVDLSGAVLDMSKSLREESGLNSWNVTDILPFIDIKTVLQDAQRTHGPVMRDNKVTFVPIFSTLGDITFFIVDISKRSTINWSMLLAKKQASSTASSEAPAKVLKPSLWERISHFEKKGRY